jgi:predicted transcriptional regulator
MMIDDKGMARRMIVGIVLVLALSTLMTPGSADPSDFIISSTPETSVMAGEEYRYQVEIEAEIESLSIVEGPEGMMLDDKVLTWTPERAGTYDIMLMAIDRSDNVATQFFSLEVYPSGRPVPELVILRPLTRSKFQAGEDIEVKGVIGSRYDTLELMPILDDDILPVVQVGGHGDWVLWLGNEIGPGKHTLTVKVNEPKGPTLTEASLEFEVLEEPVKFDTLYVVFPPFYLVLLALTMVGMSDVGVYKLSSIFIAPLYSRIKKEKALDKYIRGRIFEYIKNNPGATYNSIKRAVGISNGCLTYHLRVLDRTEIIHSKRNGTFRHFFPKEMPLPNVVFRLSPPQKSILEILDESPGISQKDLAKEAGMTTTALNYHIKLLNKAGIISVEKAGKRTKCYLVKEEAEAAV